MFLVLWLERFFNYAGLTCFAVLSAVVKKKTHVLLKSVSVRSNSEVLNRNASTFKTSKKVCNREYLLLIVRHKSSKYFYCK